MKRSGFAVKITAFMEAKPTIDEMREAAALIQDVENRLAALCFAAVKVESRFIFTKDIPDEPKAVF